MFQELDRILQELAGDREIWYRPNPGNAGDSLIALATWQRFSALGIRAREVPARGFDATGRVVLYGGGGNLNPRYREASEFIQEHHRSADRIVLLPHTVEGCEDLLSRLGPNAILFCREAVSYEHCLRHARRARVLLSHDLALGLDPTRVRLPGPAAPARLAWLAVRRKMGLRCDGPGVGEVWRALRFAARHGMVGPRDSTARRAPVLAAFRGDIESAGIPLPSGNIDLSEALMLRSNGRFVHETSASLFLGALRGYREVRTDRLHVCIAGALLGLDVELHGDAGFKCRAIWMHSLKDRHPRVRWAD